MAIAIILAAGTGERFSKQKPKQLAEVNGKAIVEYSLQAFEEHSEITEIILVMKENQIQKFEHGFRDKYKKLTLFVNGGMSRAESSANALFSLQTHSQEKVLIHDAARPLISSQIISSCLNLLETHDAVMTATPATDTIVEAKSGKVTSILHRESLWSAQTPQGFKYETIRDAYAKMQQHPDFKPTDDCGVLKRFFPEIEIALAITQSNNLKITYPSDQFLAEKLLDADDDSQAAKS
tara:strand:+ start:53 stop:763 length:711 start_codon:yes stop_codon:yes gene_type:complete